MHTPRPPCSIIRSVSIRAGTVAVLFDLDETLIPEHQPIVNAYRATAAAVFGDDPTEAQVAELRQAARRYWEAYAPCPEYRVRVHLGPSDGLSSFFPGEGPELEQLRAFVPEFHAHAFDAALPPGTPNPGRLRDIWWAARIGTPTVFEGARELLARLRGDFRLAMVTNGASDFQRRKIDAAELAGYFDAIIVSGDLGAGKPHPDPFLAALRALDVSSDQAVMVGNDQERDIAGAQALGIRTIWVQPGDPEQAGAVSDLTQIPALL